MTAPAGEPEDLYPSVWADAAGDWHEAGSGAPERPDAAFRRARHRAHSRARRGGRGYDGVTDERIYRRDKWACMMPECLCPGGTAIDPRLAGTQGPWAPSIDHIVPLAEGGLDNARNKRAAHARCNQQDNTARQLDLARGISGRPEDLLPLTSAIADYLSGPRGGRVFATLEELRAAWAAEEA